MTFRVPLRSIAVRLLLACAALSAFAFFTYQCEEAFFADRMARIPLFGTELAIAAQPRDPQYEFQLGQYWLIAAQQPETAIPHFERATELNPLSGRYWARLAIAYQQAGKSESASQAMDRGLRADPTTPEMLWQAANVSVFLGQQEKALDAIRRYVDSVPDQVPSAAQLAWRATGDANRVLASVLPRNVHSDLALLIALVRAVDPDASARVRVFDTDAANYFVHNLAILGTPATAPASENAAPDFDLQAAKDNARLEMVKLISQKTGRDWTKTREELEAERSRRVEQAFLNAQAGKQKLLAENADVYAAAAIVWRSLMAQPEDFDVRLSLPYIQMLIDSDQEQEAVRAWDLLSRRDPKLGASTVRPNLVKNASFENDLLNGGFDWQYTPADAYVLGIDHRNSKDGQSSLLVRFKDKPVPDAGIVQYVPVQPDTEYEFRGYMKADSIRTASGPRFVVQDVDASEPYFESPDLRRTADWSLMQGQFRTRPTAHFVAIRILRDPGTTLIKGNVWIDDLYLSAVRETNPSSVQGK